MVNSLQILITALGSAASLLVAAADPPVSLSISAPERTQVDVRNTGTQPINAWALAVSSRNADGGTHRVVYSADAYLTEATGDLPGAVPHLRRIMPGDARAIPIDPAPADAVVQPVALVFEDDTAWGDTATIASFFTKRAAERDQLKSVVDAFASALQNTVTPATLDELRQRLAAGEAAGSEPHRTARDAVDTWRQRAGGGANLDEIARSMRTYAAFVTRQYDLAAKHAQRKM